MQQGDEAILIRINCTTALYGALYDDVQGISVDIMIGPTQRNEIPHIMLY